MKRIVGIVLFVAGLVGSFITGMDAYQNTESVKLFGTKLTLSQADWTPVIICVAVAIIGLLLLVSSPAKSRGKSRR